MLYIIVVDPAALWWRDSSLNAGGNSADDLHWFPEACECIGGVLGGSARLYLDLNLLFLIWDDICMPWDICSICCSCQRSVTILVAIAKLSAAPAWSRSTHLSEGQRITAVTSTTGRVTAHFHRRNHIHTVHVQCEGLMQHITVYMWTCVTHKTCQEHDTFHLQIKRKKDVLDKNEVCFRPIQGYKQKN